MVNSRGEYWDSRGSKNPDVDMAVGFCLAFEALGCRL